MKYLDYFKACLNTDYLYKLDWYFSVFLTSTKDNKYVKRSNGKVEVWINNNWEVIEDMRKGLPILLFSDEVKLNQGELANVTKDISTKIGRVVFNYVVLARNFGNKIPYVNEKVNLGDIEVIIARDMITDKILTNEYLRYTDACSFIEQLSPITNISATYKNILPPDGLETKKKALYKEYEKKYGPNWKENRLYIVEFQEDLKKIDEEWLKDDPTNNKLTNAKIKDNARVKMFLTQGPEVGFDKDGGNVTFVENSLLDQYPKDKKQLAAIFNSIRSGSYDRGKETQKGGEASKIVLRGLSSYRIAKGDCKSTQGLTITVNKDIAAGLIGRYVISGNKLVEITDPNEYIGKTITIRSPMYCKYKAPDYCSTCCGKTLENSPNAIPVEGAGITGAIMYVSMKSMHNSQVNLKNIDISKIIK